MTAFDFRPRGSLSATIVVGAFVAFAAPRQSPPYSTQPVVVREVVVSNPTLTTSLVEPSIAADPRDSTHLVAAAISIANGSLSDSTVRCALYVTRDGGQRWQSSGNTTQRCGDPWLAIGTTGVAHFAMLGPRGELLVARSTDGGASWPDPPVAFGRNHDHPTLAVGPAPLGSGPASIFALSNHGAMSPGKLERFSIAVMRSDDDGVTFSQPVEITPSNLNQNSLTIATLTDGTVIAPFFDFMQNVNGFKNGGWLERPRLWVLTSSDRGASFSVPLLATERCVSRLGGFPATAVDWSRGSYRDRVYIACRTTRGIAVLWSADRGEHWSEPRDVVTDTSATERGMLGAVGLAVSPAGVVGMTWKHRRPTPHGDCHDLFFAASTDGAATFSEPLKVSSVSSCSKSVPDSATASRWPDGGDYGSLVATSDGLFHTIWADGRNGRFQLRSAAIRVP